MANKTPVFYDAGFGVYGGDDTIHHNYTENTGNVITLEKGGTGNEVLQVLNKGELAIKSVTGATNAALQVGALSTQDVLTLNDAENSDHLLTVRKLTSGTGWITDFKVRDSGAPSNDDVAFRITHDIQSNSPPQAADLLSAGYTNASEVYQELFTLKQSGELYLQGATGADILWGTDSGGDIGASGANRPDSIYAATAVNSGGTVIKAQTLELGPTAANTKSITALQTGTNDPGIRYNSGTSTWQIANDGTTWANINTGAGNDLDAAYDAFGGAGTVNVDVGTLTWDLTSPYHFLVKDTSGTNLMDITPAAGVSFESSATANVPTISVTQNDTGENGVAIVGAGSNTGNALDIDSNWTYGLNTDSPSYFNAAVELKNTTQVDGVMTFYNHPRFRDSIALKMGNSSDAQLMYGSAQSPDSLIMGLSAQSNGFVFCELEDIGINFAHPLQSNPTLFIHAADATDVGEFVGLSYLGVQADAMATDKAKFDLTVKAVDAYASAVTNQDGGNLVLVAGDAVGSGDDGDINFDARGSGSIPFNSTVDTTLTTTAQNIVGAINEVASATGNNLDEAYDVFGGAGTVNIDAGHLTWQVTNPYDFIVTDGTTNYIDVDSSAGYLDFKSAYNNGRITLACTGTSGDISLSTTGGTGTIALTSTNSTLTMTSGFGMTFSAGGTSSWTASSGNLNLTAGSGTLNLDGLYVASEADRNLTLIAGGAGTGTYAFNLESQTTGTNYVRTTAAGDLQVYADTTSATANLTLSSGGTLSISAVQDASDVDISVPNHASSDINFDAHGSGDIPFNSVADATLTTTAQNIVGAINEVAAVTPTWDAIYAGDKTLDIDSTSLAWTQTSTVGIGFYIDRALPSGSTSGPIFKVINSPVTTTDDQPGAEFEHKNNAGGALGTVVSAKSTFISGAGATGGTAAMYEAALTGHASDTSGATVFGYHATGSALGSARKYAFYADDAWDFGLISLARIYASLSDVSTNTSIYDALASTDGLTARLTGVNVGITESATDTGEIYGINIALTPNGSAANTALRAINIDTDWNYGIYSRSTGIFTLDATATSTALEVTNDPSSGLGASDVITGIDLTVTSDPTDNASANYYGLHINTNVNSGNHPSKTALLITGFSGYETTIPKPDRAILTTGGTVEFNQTITDGLGGNKHLYLTTSKFTSSGTGLDASDQVRVYNSEVAGNAGDAASVYTGYYAACSTTLGSATAIGFYADANWTYGFYSLSPAVVAGNLTSAYTAFEASPSSLGSTSIGAVYGYKVDFGDNVLDSNAQYIAFSAESNGVGGILRYGLSVDNSFTAGILVQSPENVFNYSPSANLTADVTGLKSSFFSNGYINGQTQRGLTIQTVGNGGETSGTYYGIDITGSSFSAAVNTRAININDVWDYGIYCQSEAYINVTGITGGTSNPAVYAGAASGGMTSGLTFMTGVKVGVDGDSGDTAGHAEGVYVTGFADDGGSLTTTKALRTGANWMYALEALSGHIHLETAFTDLYDVTDGAVNVVANNTSALSDTRRYAVKSYTTGHASDIPSFTMYNFHASTDSTGGSTRVGYYAGASASNFMSYGFRAENVPKALYCEFGNASVITSSSVYAPAAATDALYYSNINSSGFTTAGTWYNNAARYTYNASDTNGTWYGYFAETSGTSVAGIQTVGFRAQSSVDIGVMSYSPQNRFQRIDDTATTTQPTVLIENGDNDATGGTAPALKVSNAYTASTGKAIEIDHGYDGSNTEDTRRAIIFTNAQTNVRRVPLAMWQPRHTTTTLDWQYDGFASGATNYQRYISASTIEKYINIPLMLPHDSVIKEVKVYVYHTNTSTVAPYLRLNRHGNGGTGSNIGSTTGSTASGFQTITITGLSFTVDNVVEDYFMLYKNGAHSSASTDYIYYAEVTYEITDFAAGCGW